MMVFSFLGSLNGFLVDPLIISPHNLSIGLVDGKGPQLARSTKWVRSRNPDAFGHWQVITVILAIGPAVIRMQIQ